MGAVSERTVSGAPGGASNLPATLPRIASRCRWWPLGPQVSTCGVVRWRLAALGGSSGGRSLHTAEVSALGMTWGVERLPPTARPWDGGLPERRTPVGEPAPAIPVVPAKILGPRVEVCLPWP